MAMLNERLRSMLSVMRPHGSEAEASWVEKFIMPYAPVTFSAVTKKGAAEEPMAYAITIGESRTIFSSHVDTVHREGGYQKVYYDMKKECYHKRDNKPLGADDAAGVWLLLEMIDAGIPGLYLVHRGEERGGIGSGFMADNHDKFLKNFDRAIAFDRKATHSIITHQGTGRCCSDKFGDALASALNAADDTMEFMYQNDDSGVYTDTAEYTHLIPECTNVSVGYYDEHTPNERLYLPHLLALRDAALKIDWENLPVVREAKKPEAFSGWSNYKNPIMPKISTVGGYTKSTLCSMLSNMTRNEMDDLAYTDPETFVDMVRAYVFDEGDDDEVETAQYEAVDDYLSRNYGDALSTIEREALEEAMIRDSDDKGLL
jgi:hypothetical protein